MREGVMCPEACLFSKCLNWPIKCFAFLYKPCFFKFTWITYSHTRVSFPGFVGLSGSICINSYVSQCKIDLFLGEISWARGKQVGEKFHLVSFDEYCIAVYGLKQTSFNLISLIQVYLVGCSSASCFVLLETHWVQCVKLHLNLGQHSLNKRYFFPSDFQTFHGYLAFVHFSFAFCIICCFHPGLLGNFLLLNHYTEIKIYSLTERHFYPWYFFCISMEPIF